VKEGRMRVRERESQREKERKIHGKGNERVCLK